MKLPESSASTSLESSSGSTAVAVLQWELAVSWHFPKVACRAQAGTWLLRACLESEERMGHLWLLTRTGQCPFPIPAVLPGQLQALHAHKPWCVWVIPSGSGKGLHKFILWWKCPLSIQTPGAVILINSYFELLVFFSLWEWLYCCSTAGLGL